MRTLTILGSTGSIGTQTLEVVENLPGEFRVVALTAHRNVQLLASQARQFKVEAVALADPVGADELRDRLAGSGIVVNTGRAGLLEIAARDDIDLCLNGLVGGKLKSSITTLILAATWKVVPKCHLAGRIIAHPEFISVGAQLSLAI